MRKTIICIAAALSLLLTGCSGWMDGSHVSVTAHQEQIPSVQTGSVSAANYMQLRAALENMVKNGAETGVIHVPEYNSDLVEKGMQTAADYLCSRYPLGTYAIDTMTYEIGVSGGQPAISVGISYIHGRSEIRQIQKAADMAAVQELMERELDACGEGIVVLVELYEELDIAQMAADYAVNHPELVMETPQVAVGVYPESGYSRVVELKFTYQTSRDSLRQMQTQVGRVFTSAAYYINSDASDQQKYAQLYAFLMERFDYKAETSITPSYSLLCHGVGDSRAFAMVYAAMCKQAGLECRVISGTREGDPRSWNLIQLDGAYYHVDLLSSSEAGQLQRLTDEQMEGYVWDYSAYPAA